MPGQKTVTIIGGGLAGSEAAWQILKRGVQVRLFEMKPGVFSPAHTSPHLAELVCSNSLRSNELYSAVGLLKEEMRRLDSLVMEAADATSVPAGKALAVDRFLFSSFVEKKLLSLSGFELVREEVEEIPEKSEAVIIASGPLTSDLLARGIERITGPQALYFYDAIAPIIDADSIDFRKVFRASRYQTGEGDYINCPMNREEFGFVFNSLREGEEVPLRDFEDFKCFEGCLQIEVMASRGFQTLLYGPMKPVGLIDPLTGTQPFAVVQLRHRKPAIQPLQHGRLSDKADPSRTEPNFQIDTWTRECNVREIQAAFTAILS